MAKLFTVVGIGRINDNDTAKLRVANGKAEARARRMTWAGHVEVVLFDIPPMTKEAARTWLAANHPQLEAQIGKRPAEVKPVALEVKVNVEVAPLGAEAKLALKRAKDAARKRAKRAAEKAAREAAKLAQGQAA